MWKKVPQPTILEQKEAELVALNVQSASAVQLVQNTIDGLSETNAQIQAKIEEIDAIQKRFSDARGGLEATYNKNQRIMQNFKTMLCVE